MLTEKDSVTTATVELLANLTMIVPEAILHRLCEMLDSNSIARIHALNIFTKCTLPYLSPK